jgi:phosphate starvation-inducible membrane PsiE
MSSLSLLFLLSSSSFSIIKGGFLVFLDALFITLLLMSFKSNIHYPDIKIKWHGNIYIYPDWHKVGW